MRKLLNTTLLTVVALSVASCGQGQEKGRGEGPRALYQRSVRLMELYTDSLENARDSANIIRLSVALENKLTQLNYVFPADTDLDISEGENDTLSSMTERFVHLRDSLLWRLANPILLRPDSVATDGAANTDSVSRNN